MGDKVWLNLKNVKTDRPSKKFDDRNGKFTVREVINSHTYRLDIPPGIDNVFYVSLLRPAGTDPLPSQVVIDTQPPAIISEDGEEEYEVEEILQARTRKIGRGSHREVLVKWTGYLRPTWEPLASFEDTAALETFERCYGPATTHDGPSSPGGRG